MRRWIGLGVAVWMAQAGAASAVDPDPAKLAQARSLIAEAVVLAGAEERGRVTGAYAQALREDIVDDLAKLKDDPALGAVARAALAALARRDATSLAELRDRLVAQERSHGRAD